MAGWRHIRPVEAKVGSGICQISPSYVDKFMAINRATQRNNRATQGNNRAGIPPNNGPMGLGPMGDIKGPWGRGAH